MNDFKVKYFSASHLMQLKNQEFQEAFDEILRTFDKEEITVEYVAEAFEDAKAENNNLVFLRNMTKKHHLTKTIREQNNQRYSYFTVITDTVKTAFKQPSKEKRAAAKVLNEWLEPYRKSLSRPLLGVQSTLAKEISDEVDKVARVYDAIVTLELISVLDSIKMITADIKTNITTRSKELMAERREALLVKRRGNAKMMVFLKSIEMVLNLNGENKEIYLCYAKEINERLDYYKSALISRSTRVKTAAEKEQTNSDKQGDNAEGNITTTSTTSQSNGAMRSTPYNLTSFVDEGMDMDMQTMEKTNRDLASTDDALNGSEIKNGNSNMDKSDNEATINDMLSNKTNGVSPADGNRAVHNGANKFDHNS